MTNEFCKIENFLCTCVEKIISDKIYFKHMKFVWEKKFLFPNIFNINATIFMWSKLDERRKCSYEKHSHVTQNIVKRPENKIDYYIHNFSIHYKKKFILFYFFHFF